MISTINDLKAQLDGMGQDKAWAVITEAEYTERSAPVRKQLIQALNAQIEIHREELKAGKITKAQFSKLRGGVLAEIDEWDTRPHCTFSKWPTPEEAPLKQAKKRCREQIELYKNRIGSPKFNALVIALDSLTTIAQVEKLYNDYREIIARKQIAQLPDLHQKPATRKNAA